MVYLCVKATKDETELMWSWEIWLSFHNLSKQQNLKKPNCNKKYPLVK